MLDPLALYELADDLPDLHEPVMIHALTGFVDAGNASRITRDHLIQEQPEAGGRRVAAFDVDQLLDYRARRPSMVFHADRWEHYDAPRLTLTALRDADGTSFLLLSGPEPDLQWERFVEAVTTLIERFEVHLTIGINSVPMAVPHTRPIGVTAYATRKQLITGHEVLTQRIQVPGSVGALLEYRLGQGDRDAAGFVAHVPHYLAQSEYPAAAERLIQSIAKVAGLNLPVDDLHAAAEMVSSEVDRQVAQADEATALVKALEQQYDANARHRPEVMRAMTRPGPLPTADELAAELERFLADQPEPEDPSA